MPPALVCLSHLRWDFVYQRPNHLMARAARTRQVLFIEEPIESEAASMDLRRVDGVTVARPCLPAGLAGTRREDVLERMTRELLEAEGIEAPWLWYYTPMALPWSRSIEGSAVVYDCMDELSGFRGAPQALVALEAELFERADIVFTGGHSLYQAKADRHPFVRAMPSAVDVAHFRRARKPGPQPLDQAGIARPRIGYYGVIDERIDRDLIVHVARRRPDWQFILIGPVAKLAPEEVPSGPNIHHLGLKRYEDLPEYLRGWDVAIMPFALNEATRYISPTKTPEYLAGGKPVVSTPIQDVIEPYGAMGLVRIAATPDAFAAAIESSLAEDWQQQAILADGVLAEMSWDATWARMDALVHSAVEKSALELPDLVAPAPSRHPGRGRVVGAARRPRLPSAVGRARRGTRPGLPARQRPGDTVQPAS